MGLSSKQVSSRGVDWNQTLLQDQTLELPKASPMRKQHQQHQQQQNHQLEAVNCPRCDSSNTKFCYYNNYNKSQPRHFCRACKRHWTKGGTLRNVPVGGVRKNKRVKKSTTISTSSKSSISTSSKTTITTPTTTPTTSNTKTTPSMYEPLIHPPSFFPSQNLMSTRDSSQGNSEEFGIGNGIFLSSSMDLPQNPSLIFPFSNSSSLRSSNAYNYGEELKVMEDSSLNNTVMPSTSGAGAGAGAITQPWENIPATGNSGMEMSNYWTWEDIDSLVSTDLNVPWDDSDIKP